MRLSSVVLLAIFCFLNFTAFGQSTTQNDKPPSRCHSDEYHALMMQDSDFASKFAVIQSEARASVVSNQKFPCANGVITIPVAVHYSGNINSDSYDCLLAIAEVQVQVLNQDFGAYNMDIQSFCEITEPCSSVIDPNALSTGSCIQFCLATQNHPACSGLSDGQEAITVGQHTFTSGASCWSGYLNFFVNDGPLAPGEDLILGQAPLFGGVNPNGNGVNVSASVFGGPGIGSCISGTGLNTSNIYNLGRTATHEVGHYLGLRHVFSDECEDGDDINGDGIVGDGIDDTPNQTTPNFGCPTFLTTTCTSTAANSCGTSDFFFNFMDFVNDACMIMFTDDQARLMYNVASGHNLWAENTCNMADQPIYEPFFIDPCIPMPPLASFQVATPLIVCENNPTITFENLTENLPELYNWSFSGAGASPATSTLQHPKVSITSTGTLTVSLEASNAGGSNTTTLNFDVTVLPIGHPDCPTCVNIVTDNGFENNIWNQVSASGFELIADQMPLNGSYSAWLGGVPDETSIIYQSVFIPPSASSAVMTYSYFIATAEGCDGQDNDFAGIAIDETLNGNFTNLTTIDICTTTEGVGTWVTASFDFSSFIGTSFDIGFYAFINPNNQNTNFFVDDIIFEICTDVALAVDLLEFEAIANDQQIEVKWHTNNELNNKRFDLLRSIDPINGFEHIQTIDAKENGGEYYFVDQNVSAGITYYYQLQQVNFDNTTTDLGIVSAAIRSDFAVEISPNPATDHLTINFANPEKTTLTVDVVDIVGKIILTKEVVVDGSNIIHLDINHLHGGVYILNVSSDGIQLEHKRFLKR